MPEKLDIWRLYALADSAGDFESWHHLQWAQSSAQALLRDAMPKLLRVLDAARDLADHPGASAQHAELVAALEPFDFSEQTDDD